MTFIITAQCQGPWNQEYTWSWQFGERPADREECQRTWGQLYLNGVAPGVGHRVTFATLYQDDRLIDTYFHGRRNIGEPAPARPPTAGGASPADAPPGRPTPT